jgi:hypothetical protein
MSGNESGNGDEVALDMFTTIKSQHNNEVNNPDSVDFQHSRSSDNISEQIESPRKSASRSITVKFMKKWLKWILSLCIMCVLILSSTLKELENFLPWRIEIWKWCLFVTDITRHNGDQRVYASLTMCYFSDSFFT